MQSIAITCVILFVGFINANGLLVGEIKYDSGRRAKEPSHLEIRYSSLGTDVHTGHISSSTSTTHDSPLNFDKFDNDMVAPSNEDRNEPTQAIMVKDSEQKDLKDLRANLKVADQSLLELLMVIANQPLKWNSFIEHVNSEMKTNIKVLPIPNANSKKEKSDLKFDNMIKQQLEKNLVKAAITEYQSDESKLQAKAKQHQNETLPPVDQDKLLRALKDEKRPKINSKRPNSVKTSTIIPDSDRDNLQEFESKYSLNGDGTDNTETQQFIEELRRLDQISKTNMKADLDNLKEYESKFDDVRLTTTTVRPTLKPRVTARPDAVQPPPILKRVPQLNWSAIGLNKRPVKATERNDWLVVERSFNKQSNEKPVLNDALQRDFDWLHEIARDNDGGNGFILSDSNNLKTDELVQRKRGDDLDWLVNNGKSFRNLNTAEYLLKGNADKNDGKAKEKMTSQGASGKNDKTMPVANKEIFKFSRVTTRPKNGTEVARNAFLAVSVVTPNGTSVGVKPSRPKTFEELKYEDELLNLKPWSDGISRRSYLNSKDGVVSNRLE